LHEKEEKEEVRVSRGDHILSAYPNKTHDAVALRRRRRGRLVVLALRNQLQSLSVSFDICLVKFAT